MVFKLKVFFFPFYNKSIYIQSFNLNSYLIAILHILNSTSWSTREKIILQQRCIFIESTRKMKFVIYLRHLSVDYLRGVFLAVRDYVGPSHSYEMPNKCESDRDNIFLARIDLRGNRPLIFRISPTPQRLTILMNINLLTYLILFTGMKIDKCKRGVPKMKM